MTGFISGEYRTDRGKRQSAAAARGAASLLLLLLIAGLAGCTRSPQRPPPAPAAAPAAPPLSVSLPAAEAIPQLIADERVASRSQDIALLAQLWAEDARIVDSRGTQDPADDFTWSGRAAILDRYMLAVFPAPPPSLAEPPSPTITVQNDEAQAVNGQDRWRFVQRDGRWWLSELRY